MIVNIVRVSPRLTWTKPNGEWGIPGVDLGTLPPQVYGALCKLKHIEDELERVQAVSNSDTALEDEYWL